jgi:AcrR family transcriptional regulator
MPVSVPSPRQDTIVQTALQIARTQGLKAVTMRAVAAQLEVTPMALYRHLADREELMRLVADRVGELVRPQPPQGAGWQDRARAWAVAQRRVLRDYPGLAGWLMENGPAGPQAYRLLEELAATLTDAGLTDTEIAHGATLVMSWTFSRVAIEDNAAARDDTDGDVRARAFVVGLESVDPTQHRTATRIGPVLFALSMSEIFDRGLDTILLGLTAGTKDR